MKKSEWAPGVLETFRENYDFTTCQRADGSYYGTGGQCRKGTEATLPKKEKGTRTKAKEMAAQARKEAAAETGPGSMRDRFNKSKKTLGEGAYGEVRETASGTVIKKGMIGTKEIEIQQRLADVDGVPKIIGVQYSSKPFKDRGGDRMGIVEMEKANGKSLWDHQAKLDNNIKGATATKIADQYIKLRGELHKRGVSHGDMHEGNLTWNGKKLGVIDFGLSKTGSKAALREAMGTKQNDLRSQGVLDELRRSGGKSGKAQTQFSKNLEKIEKRLGIDNPADMMMAINKMSDKKAASIIEELYDGV